MPNILTDAKTRDGAMMARLMSRANRVSPDLPFELKAMWRQHLAATRRRVPYNLAAIPDAIVDASERVNNSGEVYSVQSLITLHFGMSYREVLVNESLRRTAPGQHSACVARRFDPLGTIRTLQGGIECDKCGEYCEREAITHFPKRHSWETESNVCVDCAVECNSCCEIIRDDDDSHTVYEGGDTVQVCEYCYERKYCNCERCGDTFNNDEMETDNNGSVCQRCYENYYYRCDSCNCLVDSDNVHSSRDGDSTYCESCYENISDGGSHCHTNFTTSFEIFGVKNGKFHTLECEREYVTYNGLTAINNMLAENELPRLHLCSDACNWIDKRGKFTTRFGQVYKSVNNVDLTRTKVTVTRRKAEKDENGAVKRDEFNSIVYASFDVQVNALDEIGNIAGQHKTSTEPLSIAFTRKVGVCGEGHRFCNDGSCWYGEDDYASSLCRFKGTGGIGVRFYRGDSPSMGDPDARVWLFPVKVNLTGESLNFGCDPDDANGYVLFNAYASALGLSNPLSQLAEKVKTLAGENFGMQEINFDPDEMYINDDKAYLITTNDIFEYFTETGVSVDRLRHRGINSNCSCR